MTTDLHTPLALISAPVDPCSALTAFRDAQPANSPVRDLLSPAALDWFGAMVKAHKTPDVFTPFARAASVIQTMQGRIEEQAFMLSNARKLIESQKARITALEAVPPDAFRMPLPDGAVTMREITSQVMVKGGMVIGALALACLSPITSAAQIQRALMEQGATLLHGRLVGIPTLTVIQRVEVVRTLTADERARIGGDVPVTALIRLRYAAARSETGVKS